ncbi:hypothetical protein CKO25_18070 [Thiocapsa imhoffii]|uniref:Uncharacterized protein n=1 Tax=Thiocapsa imhoffii TaxID=382777 RepID=A0A9X0WLC8_9GAMM|nr:hypothetical protein [Thiocapsa imhoffii]MBK1646515.1 hypothetical protein [Thiocapsa imhoffii]
MKTITTFAAVSMLAVSSVAMAEQQLTLSEMDGITAGTWSADSFSIADSLGGYLFVETRAEAEVDKPSVRSLAGSFTSSIGGFNIPSIMLTADAASGGEASGASSASTSSGAATFAQFGERTATAFAGNVTFASGSFSRASSASSASASVSPLMNDSAR